MEPLKALHDDVDDDEANACETVAAGCKIYILYIYVVVPFQ
jgi:hypothetical protein